MTVNVSDKKEKKGDPLEKGAKGGAIALSIQVSNAALGFLNTIILARLLGAGGMGEIVLATTIVGISGLIADFGMNGAMVVYVPKYIEKGELGKLNGIIRFALMVCVSSAVMCTFLIMLLSEYIAINVFHSQGLAKLLLVVAIAVPATVLNEVIGGILRGYKDTFKALFPHLVVMPCCRLVIFLLLCLISISPLYAIIAYISGEVISMIVSLIFLLKKMDRIQPVYEGSEYKKVVTLASTMIFTNVSWFVFTQSDVWIIGMYSSIENVGIYNVAAKLVILISFALGAFSTIIPAIVSSVFTSGDQKELQRVIRESSRWILTSSIPIILILIIEGKYILKYAYGEKFLEGYIPLVILSIGQLINAGVGLVGWFLQMTGIHKAFMKVTLLGGISNIILNIILVPRFGIIGAAFSTSLCISLVNIISVWIIYKRLSVIMIAKDLKYDIVFIAVVAALFLLFGYNNMYIGQHILVVVSVAVYLWRSLINGNLPWRYVLAKHKTG